MKERSDKKVVRETVVIKKKKRDPWAQSAAGKRETLSQEESAKEKSPENQPQNTEEERQPVPAKDNFGDDAKRDSVISDKTSTEEKSPENPVKASETEEEKKSDDAAEIEQANDKKTDKKAAKRSKADKKQKKKKNKRPKNPNAPYTNANAFERAYMAFLDLELGRRIARRKLRFAAGVLACIIAFGVIYTLWDNNQIGTTFYQIQSNKVSNNIRVVCLADLHLKEFGKDNERLIERIQSLKPDIIACAGDMNTYKEDDYGVVTSLCAELSNIAPIYYCLGNHEYEAWLFKDSKICDDLKKIGVKVLHNQSEKVIIGTSTIDIGGLSESPKQFEQYGHDFFDKYVESDDFKLLLNHYPEAFLGTMDNYYVDLCLCGHAHGGQIRLPFIGGLYSADQGFFPKFVDGMHVDEEGGGSTFIVSRGLGNSSWMPRINNRPELVVVDINWY